MGASVVYRNATMDDVTGMHDLWHQIWPSQLYEKSLPAKIQMDPELVLLAESEGLIVGTIIGGFDGWWAWIYKVAVHKDYQGHGIASYLFEEMHRRLQSRGADGVGLFTSMENEPMQALLKKLGYAKRNDTRFSFIFR